MNKNFDSLDFKHFQIQKRLGILKIEFGANGIFALVVKEVNVLQNCLKINNMVISQVEKFVSTPPLKKALHANESSTAENQRIDDDEMHENVESRFDYKKFLRRMRHPQCASLVGLIRKKIEYFERHCGNELPEDDLKSQYLRSFMEDTMMPALQANPVWRLANDGATQTDYDYLGREGVEYLLMSQLHSLTFNSGGEVEMDTCIDRNVALHARWIKPEHLDLPNDYLHRSIGENDFSDNQSFAEISEEEKSCTESTDSSFDDNSSFEFKNKISEDKKISFEGAIFEFRRVNSYITPRDKLICLLNGTRIMQNLLPKDCGADDLVPSLIYTLLHARVGRLHANLQYIRRYRAMERLQSSAYYFTSLEAAAEFISRLNRTMLTIDPEEYDKHMEDEVSHINKLSLLANVTEIKKSNKILSDSRSSVVRSPSQSALREEGELVVKTLSNVGEKLALGATRSIDYIGKLLDEAEARMRASRWGSVINKVKPSPEIVPVKKDLVDDLYDSASFPTELEEDYQIQLAMAISLSEVTTDESLVTGEKLIIDENRSFEDGSLDIDVHSSPGSIEIGNSASKSFNVKANLTSPASNSIKKSSENLDSQGNIICESDSLDKWSKKDFDYQEN